MGRGIAGVWYERGVWERRCAMGYVGLLASMGLSVDVLEWESLSVCFDLSLAGACEIASENYGSVAGFIW